jgi:hypothetical protein
LWDRLDLAWLIGMMPAEITYHKEVESNFS